LGAEITPFGCVVLGAGEVVDPKRLAGLIAPGPFVICADGGLIHAPALGLTPNLLVGDFDSLTEPPIDIPRVTLSPEKNYTDSFYAARQAVEYGHTRLLLTGMLGGRLDHTLANIQLLAGLAKDGADAMVTDGQTDLFALAGSGQRALPCRAGCYFSLFALETCRGLSIFGAKYRLDNHTLRPHDPRAISNEFAGQDVVISQTGGLLAAVVTPKNSLPR